MNLYIFARDTTVTVVPGSGLMSGHEASTGNAASGEDPTSQQQGTRPGDQGASWEPMVGTSASTTTVTVTVTVTASSNTSGGNSCLNAAAFGTVIGSAGGLYITGEAAPFLGAAMTTVSLATFGIAVPIIGLVLVAAIYYYEPNCQT